MRLYIQQLRDLSGTEKGEKRREERGEKRDRRLMSESRRIEDPPTGEDEDPSFGGIDDWKRLTRNVGGGQWTVGSWR